MIIEGHQSARPIINRLLQLMQAYRLGDEAISPLIDAFIPAAGAAGDEDNPGALRPAFPDDPCSLQPIHFGHLNVHEHQVIRMALHGVQMCIRDSL